MIDLIANGTAGLERTPRHSPSDHRKPFSAKLGRTLDHTVRGITYRCGQRLWKVDRECQEFLGLSFCCATTSVIVSAAIAFEGTFFAAVGVWPREFLSLGSAVRKDQKRPSAIAKSGDFSGIFTGFGYSGGEEWI